MLKAWSKRTYQRNCSMNHHLCKVESKRESWKTAQIFTLKNDVPLKIMNDEKMFKAYLWYKMVVKHILENVLIFYKGLDLDHIMKSHNIIRHVLDINNYYDFKICLYTLCAYHHIIWIWNQRWGLDLFLTHMDNSM